MTIIVKFIVNSLYLKIQKYIDSIEWRIINSLQDMERFAEALQSFHTLNKNFKNKDVSLTKIQADINLLLRMEQF